MRGQWVRQISHLGISNLITPKLLKPPQVQVILALLGFGVHPGPQAAQMDVFDASRALAEAQQRVHFRKAVLEAVAAVFFLLLRLLRFLHLLQLLHLPHLGRPTVLLPRASHIKHLEFLQTQLYAVPLAQHLHLVLAHDLPKAMLFGVLGPA